MPLSNRAITERYDFGAWLASRRLALPPTGIDTLWLNITRLCNQACRHCHMEASPEKPLHMGEDVMAGCLRVLEQITSIKTVDITGGAPELHPRFEQLVEACRALGKHVVVRHNLTVTIDDDPLSGKPKDHLPEFFAVNGVELLASLPYCNEEATDAVRGSGVFEKSIESLRRLNAAGYSINPELKLKLVANYDGPLGEADRINIEREFKDALACYGIGFDDLLTVTNMPAGRYAESLRREGRYQAYMDALFTSASETAARTAVCRNLISVDIDGRLYDCDFNQALDFPIGTVFDFDYDALLHRKIAFGSHCFGCITGAGSG
jgi:radical SAM/Cys-rich protein